MVLKFCLIVCLLQIISYNKIAAGGGKYTVIAPGTIYSIEKYTAVVLVYNVSTPCKMKVSIDGPAYSNSEEFEIQQNNIKNVVFNIRHHLKEGPYYLNVESINCLDNFKNKTKVNYKKLSNFVKIQTDKGVYKPGDDINFRVLFLNKDLKPAKPESRDVIFFEDSKHNRIKEIRNFTVNTGVYTGKFRVPDYPVMGRWRLDIEPKSADFQYPAHFYVAKYVLPKFNVEVEATMHASTINDEINVIVSANYTYGNPVNGETTLTLSSHSFYSLVSEEKEKKNPILTRTTKMVQGKAYFNLLAMDYAAYFPYKEGAYFVTITATVEEEFTDVKVNGSTFSLIYPYRYVFYCLSKSNCDSFTAGKEMELLYQITRIDDSYINDTKSTVELIYKEVLIKINKQSAIQNIAPISDDRTGVFSGHMNETGFINFKVSFPELTEYDGYIRYYSVEVKYKEEQRKVHDIYQYKKPKITNVQRKEMDNPKEYFFILDKNKFSKNMVVNQPKPIMINSSRPLSYFNYNIVGRGNILKSEHVVLANKTKFYNFTITPDFSWVPSIVLYCYYVDEEGGYHYSENFYFIDFVLPNEINISGPNVAEPGQKVSLKIQTSENSFIGLMAVDQNALMLSKNHDLKQYEIHSMLGSHVTTIPNEDGFSPYPGAISGCVTLTNANYVYNWTEPHHNISWEKEWSKSGVSSKASKNSRFAGDFVGGFASRFGGAFASRFGGGFGGGFGVGYGGLESSDSSFQVRKDFSKTWLFADLKKTNSTEFIYDTKIPETPTSWVLTGFSISPSKGLAITKGETRITTFKRIFISIRLPYSVKRGEVIKVPALVFNYVEADLDFEVKLENIDNQYEFTEFHNVGYKDQARIKSIRVAAKAAAGVSFLIRAIYTGNILLKFTVTSPVGRDVILKSLKVVPEGITKYVNRAYFVNFEDEEEFKDSFGVDIHETIVADSVHAEIGVMGDILGPVFNNLGNLVRLPTGGGEQTTSSLLPNYLLMKHLKNSNRLTPYMETKLRFNLESGYQNILSYRHEDGSFSNFGPSKIKEKPNNGSTWLTAYIMRSLQQIKEFININDKIIGDGMKYLSKQQAKNGTFTESGDYFYKSQRNHVAVTSAVILAYLESPTYAYKYSQQLQNGIQFLVQNVNKNSSLYAQAIGTYTLSQAKHGTVFEKLRHLESFGIIDSDHMWWSEREQQSRSENELYFDFNNDVEITSYTLLSLLQESSTTVDYVLPIINWLIAQRNSFGGFSSTQDTVVGLTALINFAKYADYQPAEMDVVITAKNKIKTIQLNEDNRNLYHSVEMPPKTKSINLNAKGKGSALVQVAYQYNIIKNESTPSFTIANRIIATADRPLNSKMEVCVNYTGDGQASNMAVLEISTLSGYEVEDEIIEDIKHLERVSHTEVINSNSKLLVYFDHLYKDNEICLMFNAVRRHAVAQHKPASILLYDYYDTSKRATKFYTLFTRLCDICENDKDCSICK